MPLTTTGTQLGGNIRVGLENSLMISRGKLAKSNAELVSKIRRIIEDLGVFKTTPPTSCCSGIIQRISNGNKKPSYRINIGR